MRSSRNTIYRSAVIICLVPLFMGATYYVDNGHASCNDSATCGSESAPCCTISAADGRNGLSSGDTVYIKAGTYTGAYYSDPSGTHCFDTDTHSGHARLATNGVTWSVFGTDTVTIDLQNQQHQGFCVTGDDVTITSGDGDLNIINKADTGSDLNRSRTACISGWKGNDQTIRGVDCFLADNAAQGNISSHVCYRMYEGSGWTLEDSTCEGEFNTGIYVYNGMRSDDDDGVIVYNNHLRATNNESSGSQASGMIIQGCGTNNNSDNLVVAGNTIDYTSAGSLTKRAFYIRDTGAPIYIFNNFIKGADRGFYFQDGRYLNEFTETFAEEEVHIFNNTIISDGSPIDGVSWPEYFTADVSNNIFHGFSTCVDMRDGYCTSAHCPHTDSSISSSEEFSFNVCFREGSTPNIFNENDHPFAGDKTGNLTGDPLLDTASGEVNSESGSGVGNGVNDPEDSGDLHSCTVTANGKSFNCAYDHHDGARGSTWDIGMDEHGVGGGGSPVAGPENLRRGDTR